MSEHLNNYDYHITIIKPEGDMMIDLLDNIKKELQQYVRLRQFRKSESQLEDAINKRADAHYGLLCMEIMARGELYNEPEARKHAEEYGLPLRPLKSAVQSGSERVYDFCLCLMAHGVPDLEDLSRKLAEVYGFSDEPLEQALETGSNIHDTHLSSITGDEPCTSHGEKFGYSLNRLKSEFLDSEYWNEIHDSDALMDVDDGDKTIYVRIKDWKRATVQGICDVLIRSPESECTNYLRESGIHE